MRRPSRQIVLIGFKHVGKTQIGKRLAQIMKRPFFDIDRQLEKAYHRDYGEWLISRQIMQRHGEAFFRQLETKALRRTLAGPWGIVATGGGTPLLAENQWLLKRHRVIYIHAPPELVFARIMRRGRPAFFADDVDPYLSFQRLWSEREPIYRSLTSFVVENNGSVMDSVEQILQKISQ